jgi:phospholipid/cholesterol/gamma-HCH transport system permease protein
MKVGEQLDAMRTMGADPVDELVLPRFLATLLVLPLLTAFAEALGVAGAMLISRLSLDINMTYYFYSTLQAVTPRDFIGGLIKTLFFAGVISLVACEHGLNVEGGTAGVGRATTRTVVIASISVLISDFILTNVLLAFNF